MSTVSWHKIHFCGLKKQTCTSSGTFCKHRNGKTLKNDFLFATNTHSLLWIFQFAEVSKAIFQIQSLIYLFIYIIWFICCSVPSVIDGVLARDTIGKEQSLGEDKWACDCNAISVEGSQRKDYKWQAVSHYQTKSRGAQEINWHRADKCRSTHSKYTQGEVKVIIDYKLQLPFSWDFQATSILIQFGEQL